MLNSILALLTKLVTPLVSLGVFLMGFFRGKSNYELKATKKALNNARKADDIEENNLTKSDVVILNELLKRDSRREP